MKKKKKTTDQIKSNIILNIIDNVDEVNDANIGSVLDFFVTGFSQELEEQYEDLDLIYKGTRINTATGDDLEQLGLIVGTERRDGVFATGTVTFRRVEPTQGSFTISRNSIVSTQPNTQEFTYEFKVVNNVTFPPNIENESHTFRDGIYEYTADQRFIEEITDISGTSGGTGITFEQDVDYELIKDAEREVIDIGTINVVDDCTTPADWTAALGASTPTQNTTEYYYSTSSLNLIKTDTAMNTMRYSATLTPTQALSGREIFFMLYIEDATQLAKINSVTMYVGSSAGILDSFEFEYANADLSIGWNRLKLDPLSPLISQNGQVDNGNINYLRIQIETSSTNDTFSAGNLLMDMWYFATSQNYEGDVIVWDKDTAGNIPDDVSTFNINYVPLSVEVDVIANEVGSDYNVIAGRVNRKVTNIPNIDRLYNYNRISGGVDVEDDETYRDRVKNATFLQTNATVEAIRYSILGLDFVRTVNVLDMPEQQAENEPHIYDTNVDKYKLNSEVAQNDSNLIVGDTVGGDDYINGTDFILTENNEIDWSVGGTNPTDGATFYVNYRYRKLGHFTVYVVGADGPLTSTQLTEVEDVVEDTRSAGVVGDVLEPTYTTISINITLDLETQYTVGLVEDNITLSIAEYFSKLGPGDDVVLNRIIKRVIDVDGVYDCTVTDIGGGGSTNYTISEAEVALLGNITLSTI